MGSEIIVDLWKLLINVIRDGGKNIIFKLVRLRWKCGVSVL